MKKIFSKLMMLLCAATTLVGCDESGDKIYLDGFKASELRRRPQMCHCL